jgi:hypothetical protein
VIFLTYIKKESFFMIAKKCFLIMRRLIDLGPKNTMLLLYYKWRKRLFLSKRAWPTRQSLNIQLSSGVGGLHAIFHDPVWRSTWPLAFHDTQAMYQKADATVARNFTILGFGTYALPTPLPWQSDFISPL